MPNIAIILKQEIARIARREMKQMFQKNLSRIAELRSALIKQKRALAAIQKLVEDINILQTKEKKSRPSDEALLRKSRLNGSGIARLRHKFKLSRNALGKILGINQNSIYLWEVDKTTPRAKMKARLVELRRMGKREVKKLLKEIENKKTVLKRENTPGTVKSFTKETTPRRPSTCSGL